MNLPDIKDLVRDGKKATFVRYQSGELWYRCEDGFEFPVPLADTGDGAFLAEDNALVLMRWIRKHLALIQSGMDAQQVDDTNCDSVGGLKTKSDEACEGFTGPSGRCSTCYWPAAEHPGSVPRPKDRRCVAFVGTNNDECTFCCLPFKWHTEELKTSSLEQSEHT